jgi:hypothetical protein
MLIGIFAGGRLDRCMTLLIGAMVLYYMTVGTSMHVEIRYTLPMQAVLFVFAGLGAIWLLDNARRCKRGTLDPQSA